MDDDRTVTGSSSTVRGALSTTEAGEVTVTRGGATGGNTTFTVRSGDSSSIQDVPVTTDQYEGLCEGTHFIIESSQTLREIMTQALYAKFGREKSSPEELLKEKLVLGYEKNRGYRTKFVLTQGPIEEDGVNYPRSDGEPYHIRLLVRGKTDHSAPGTMPTNRLILDVRTLKPSPWEKVKEERDWNSTLDSQVVPVETGADSKWVYNWPSAKLVSEHGGTRDGSVMMEFSVHKGFPKPETLANMPYYDKGVRKDNEDLVRELTEGGCFEVIDYDSFLID